MLTLLFWILMFMTFGKILKFAIKAAWGITKIMVSLVFLPIVLIFLVLQGLLVIAMPILLILGAIAFLVFHD